MTAAVLDLLDTLRRRGVCLWVDGARLVIRGQQTMPAHLLDRIRLHKTEVIAELLADTRPGEPLALELIDRYRSLDDHSRGILAGFARRFPESKIEWLPRTAEKGQAE